MKYYIAILLSIFLVSCGGKVESIPIDSKEGTEKEVVATQKESEKIVEQKEDRETREELKITGIKNDRKEEEERNKITKTNCVRQYDFLDDLDHKDTYYRRLEFNFKGDCKKQEIIPKFDVNQGELFKIDTGGQMYYYNSRNSNCGSFCHGGICHPQETYKEEFKKGTYVISIFSGQTKCVDGYADPPVTSILKTGGIAISVRGSDEKGFDFHVDNISLSDLERQYKDLLWTMRNGFREIK